MSFTYDYVPTDDHLPRYDYVPTYHFSTYLGDDFQKLHRRELPARVSSQTPSTIMWMLAILLSATGYLSTCQGPIL